MIRNATEHDFLTCFDIAHRAWPTFKERESIYHLFCKHFSDTSFIYEQESTISGFALGFLSQTQPNVWYVHLIAVDPDSQKHGIAGALYQHVFARAREIGRSKISCIVNPDNPASLKLHAKLGFVIDTSGDVIVDHGVVAARDYNGPGLHMVRFNKQI
jgi:ribosomal protein S18 acetylase RimI-like enzyme